MPRVAVDGVVALAAADAIVVLASGDGVVAGATVDAIVARASRERVVAYAAEDDVVAGVAGRGVVALAGPDEVGPVPAVIVSFPANARITSACGVPLSDVVPARALDQCCSCDRSKQREPASEPATAVILTFLMIDLLRCR